MNNATLDDVTCYFVNQQNNMLMRHATLSMKQ